MTSRAILSSSLEFPFAAPAYGDAITVAPGLLWASIPLPFRLNHINVYAFEDGPGWAVLDTGLDYPDARAAWERLLAGPLAGRPLTQVIVSHLHPDHIGLAGWLCERYDIPLVTTQSAYLGCLNVALRPGTVVGEAYASFFVKNGFDRAAMHEIVTEGHDYLWKVAPLPPTFSRIVAGDTLSIGGRSFSVLTGDGHAAEQAMLYDRASNIFLAADQVLAKITPNVSVWPVDPKGDNLGLYLRSLGALQHQIDAGALVLPGHQLPFRNLHVRCRELIEHHESRCAAIIKACSRSPLSGAELVPVIFDLKLDAHQMGFAFTEVMSHVNYLERQARLSAREGSDGVIRWSATGPAGA